MKNSALLKVSLKEKVASNCSLTVLQRKQARILKNQ